MRSNSNTNGSRQRFVVHALLVLVAFNGGCSRGVDRSSGLVFPRGAFSEPIQFYPSFFNDATTAVIALIDKIEPNYSQERLNYRGEAPDVVVEYDRVHVSKVEVIAATAWCLRDVVAAGHFQFTWMSQTVETFPKVEGPDGTWVPAAQLGGQTFRRPAAKTLIPGERALFFAECPSVDQCASTGCPNPVSWKLPLYEADTVDLSPYRSIRFGPGPARIPVREALALIAEDVELGLPSYDITVLPRLDSPDAEGPR
jgi:hypothetical protein